jgi:hypothetical protein
VPASPFPSGSEVYKLDDGIMAGARPLEDVAGLDTRRAIRRMRGMTNDLQH